MWTEYSLFVVLWQDEKEDVNAAVGKAHSQRFESNRQESPLRGAFVLVSTRPRAGRGFDSNTRRSKCKSHPIKLDGLYILVEAAGIEPASASPLQAVLHT